MAELYFAVDRGGLKQERGPGGRFAPGSRSELNVRLLNRADQQAEVLRASAGQLVRASLVRPHESTGRLERAHSHRRNVLVTPTTIGIGREDWLDQATAEQGRYWRLIEQGTTQFVGRQLTILNKNHPGRGSRGRGASDPGLRMVKPGRSGAFGAFGSGNVRDGRRNFRSTTGRRFLGPSGNIVIRVPILPHRLYDQLATQERGRLTRFAVQQARDYFADRASGR